MIVRSLKSRLLGLWLLSLLASIAVGLLLIQLYRQSSEAQLGRAEAVIARACGLIAEHYAFYTSGWSGTSRLDPLLRQDLAAIVGLTLRAQDGVTGGIWQSDAGALADSGSLAGLSVETHEQIRAINQRVASDDQPADHRLASASGMILLHACPLDGPISGLSAWTMARVQNARPSRSLEQGVGVLLALMAAMSIGLGRTLLVWRRHVTEIATALGRTGPDGMPPVPPTGEREFDRIIDALNEAGQRLAEARREAEALSIRMARAERLAGLGRIAAGVAHEIRNPIAALRLQGENALAGDDARRRSAIGDMLGQITRLDALAGELLAMTQRVEPKPVTVDLATFLAAQIAGHREMAAAKSLTMTIRDSEGTAWLDPLIIGRVLDNLLTNAIRHAPAGGAVTLSVARGPARLTLLVGDTGAGVMPDMAAHLFEPFVTGRADGTGLGLAIARELADAHGGQLSLHHPGGDASESGAVFALDLPQEA